MLLRILVCACEPTCEHSSCTVHCVCFFPQSCLTCHCNVCDIKWTKQKLQISLMQTLMPWLCSNMRFMYCLTVASNCEHVSCVCGAFLINTLRMYALCHLYRYLTSDNEEHKTLTWQVSTSRHTISQSVGEVFIYTKENTINQFTPWSFLKSKIKCKLIKCISRCVNGYTS